MGIKGYPLSAIPSFYPFNCLTVATYLYVAVLCVFATAARSRMRKKRQEETVCPVCNKKVTGTAEELNEHVELCLKKVQKKIVSYCLNMGHCVKVVRPLI